MILIALAALALTPPLTPNESVLARHCLEQGATEAECACGIERARELMTEREIAIAADLAPALSSSASLEEGLMAVPLIAQRQGYSMAEVAAGMQKVFEHAEAVELHCTDAG